MTRTSIDVAGPPPAVPLSRGARIGPLLQVAGHGGFDPTTGELDGVSIADQTRSCLLQVSAVLEAGGASTDDVLMVRTYLTDPADFDAMNEVYREYFTEPYPARTTVYVGLPPGLLIEIDALAVPTTPSPEPEQSVRDRRGPTAAQLWERRGGLRRPRRGG